MSPGFQFRVDCRARFSRLRLSFALCAVLSLLIVSLSYAPEDASRLLRTSWGVGVPGWSDEDRLNASLLLESGELVLPSSMSISDLVALVNFTAGGVSTQGRWFWWGAHLCNIRAPFLAVEEIVALCWGVHDFNCRDSGCNESLGGIVAVWSRPLLELRQVDLQLGVVRSGLAKL